MDTLTYEDIMVKVVVFEDDDNQVKVKEHDDEDEQVNVITVN